MNLDDVRKENFHSCGHLVWRDATSLKLRVRLSKTYSER